jgi:hypothetical protein
VHLFFCGFSCFGCAVYLGNTMIMLHLRVQRTLRKHLAYVDFEVVKRRKGFVVSESKGS